MIYVESMPWLCEAYYYCLLVGKSHGLTKETCPLNHKEVQPTNIISAKDSDDLHVYLLPKWPLI